MKKACFLVLATVAFGVLVPALADAGTYYIRKREPDPVPGAVTAPEPAPPVTNRYIAKPKAPAPLAPTGQTVMPASAAMLPPSGPVCSEADMKIASEYNGIMNKTLKEMQKLKNEPGKINKETPASAEHAAKVLNELYANPANIAATAMARARCAGPMMQALLLQTQQQQQGKKSK